MIKDEIKEAILTLHQQGIKIREISRVLKVSRNTVKKVLQGKSQKGSEKASCHEEIKPVIEELL